MKQASTTTETKSISLVEWFNGTPELLKLGFTEQEIEKAILDSGNDINSLTDIEGFSQFPSYHKRAELVDSNYWYTKTNYVNQGGKQYENRERVRGIGVRVPAHYQGLRHDKILFALFSAKWSWFDSFRKKEECEIKKYLSDLPISQIPDQFKDLTPAELRREYLIEKQVNECTKWSIYELRNDGEMYLTTQNGSLYVPIAALVEKDFSIIEKRMTEYHASYYNASGYGLNHRGRTQEEYKKDQQEAYYKAMSALTSPEALQLKEYLSK